MTMWSEGDVNANGVWLHYYRTGGKKPPLLMAHGLTDNGLCWSPLSRALEEQYDLIMVDARGHGMSDAPEQGYTSREQAADYAEVIRSLKLEQPAMIGHSMGAATTAFLAATQPGLISCALLEDPPWRPLDAAATPEQRIVMAEEWRKQVVAKRQQDEVTLITGVRLEHPSWPDAELGAVGIGQTPKLAQGHRLCALSFAALDRICGGHWLPNVAVNGRRGPWRHCFARASTGGNQPEQTDSGCPHCQRRPQHPPRTVCPLSTGGTCVLD